jgi:sRNA-binding regulator protein Hfq
MRRVKVSCWGSGLLIFQWGISTSNPNCSLFFNRSQNDPCLYLVNDFDAQAAFKSFDELQLFDKTDGREDLISVSICCTVFITIQLNKWKDQNFLVSDFLAKYNEKI